MRNPKYIRITPSGANIDVDSDLSSESLNPVENRAIVAALADYFTKAQTYDRETINGMFEAASKLSARVVDVLPTASEETMGYIYLVPNGGSGSNVKDEYLTAATEEDGTITYSWEKFGTTEIDLSGYATTAQLTTHTDDTTNPHNTNMQNLTDTSVANPASGEVLAYNGTTWSNTTLPEGTSVLEVQVFS